jgi:predicted ribosome quality control (RQC) complex YloA/Tae2 family protein
MSESRMAVRPAALFDSLTLAAVASDIRALGRARFTGVRQPAADTIVVSLAAGRAAHHLLCCIHPTRARVHVARRPESTERLGPFGTLLRSRLVDARLVTVDQPPFNRLLRLGFDALEGRLWLVAEVMGRHSNLVLAGERAVLGALKVVTPRMSPRRPVLPGRPYVPPPADRPTPLGLDVDGLRAILRSSASLERRLSQALLGVSPTLAREIALRAGIDPAAPAEDSAGSAGALFETLRSIAASVERNAFSPTVYTDAGRVAAFAPFPMRVFEHLSPEATATMSEAVDRYYRQDAPADALDERRKQLNGAIGAALRQREEVLEENRRIIDESGRADRYRVLGDLILTHAHEVRPRDRVLRVPDYTGGGAEVEIPLDPALTPSENAQQYYRRYAKARATTKALPARMARLQTERDALTEALVQVEAATSPDDLWEIHSGLAEMGVVGRGPRSRPPAKTGPRRFRTADGATILVGRSARENDRVTFREGGPEDLWFHARGVAGAHVILKAAGRPSPASIEAAARLAAYYSEGRTSGQVAVDSVERKHVRKPRGGAPGVVTYTGERTTLVAPARPPVDPAAGHV